MQKIETVYALNTGLLKFITDGVVTNSVSINGDLETVTLSAHENIIITLSQFIYDQFVIAEFLGSLANRLSFVTGGIRGEFKILREKKVFPSRTKIFLNFKINNSTIADFEYVSDTKNIIFPAMVERTLSYLDYRFFHDSINLFIADIKNN